MRNQVDRVNQMGIDRADDVLELVHSVMHVFRARQFRLAEAGGSELAFMEGKVLAFFARHPGATQRELVEHSGRDKGQIARLIGGLKERGLLVAHADAHDRRMARLELTEHGAAVHRALHLQRRRLAKSAVAGLSGEQRQQLVDLLLRVRANLEDAG